MTQRWLWIGLLLIAAPLRAQTSCSSNPGPCSTAPGTVRITITIAPAFALSISPATSTLAAPTPAMYDAGFAITNGPTATIRSNAPWTLAISASSATWNATNTGTEPARTNKPASDLQWATSVAGPFTATTTTPASITSGSATAGSAVALYYRTLYSWGLDTPGSYSLQVVFTITAP
ncbi:MAG TPA: hypothetical protein VF021_00160 [Longimicrobiales bacterium]